MLRRNKIGGACHALQPGRRALRPLSGHGWGHNGRPAHPVRGPAPFSQAQVLELKVSRAVE